MWIISFLYSIMINLCIFFWHIFPSMINISWHLLGANSYHITFKIIGFHSSHSISYLAHSQHTFSYIYWCWVSFPWCWCLALVFKSHSVIFIADLLRYIFIQYFIEKKIKRTKHIYPAYEGWKMINLMTYKSFVFFFYIFWVWSGLVFYVFIL